MALSCANKIHKPSLCPSYASLSSGYTLNSNKPNLSTFGLIPVSPWEEKPLPAHPFPSTFGYFRKQSPASGLGPSGLEFSCFRTLCAAMETLATPAYSIVF